MTRDGLVESNLTTGTEQRISGRLEDVSFEGKSRNAQETPLYRPPQRQREASGGNQHGKRYQQKFTQQGQESTAPVSEPSAEQADTGGAAPFADMPTRPINPAPSADNRGRLSFSQDDATPLFTPKNKPTAHPADATPAQPQTASRLQFGKANADIQPPSRQRKNTQKAEFSATSETASRLHFEPEQRPPMGESSAADEPSAAHGTSAAPKAEQKGASRQQNKQNMRFEKAEQRVQHSAEKLEKAKEKLPTKRRVHLEKQYDSDSGKVKRRLQFEQEVLPQGYKGNPLKRGGKALFKGAGTAALFKGHQKIRQVEQQNVAVEAAHKTEFVAERITGRGARLLFRHVKNAPYERVAKWERKTTKAKVNAAYQKTLRDNPALQKKPLAKLWQKRNIKRQYAKAARDAGKAAQRTKKIAQATGQAARAIAHFAAANKGAIAVVALAALLIILLGAGVSSCTAMLSGMSTSVISTCYLSDEEHIESSELLYTELETDLQQDVDSTEARFPGFDEYRYNIGEISHNPYELMAYLSAVYDIFTFDEVQGEIRRLFSEQYSLSREEIVEVRYRTETDPETGEETEVPYNWYVLQTTLTVRPLSQIIAESLPPGDPSDRYALYMQTYGNRQAFGNPFSFPWLVHVTSPYGYRVHPITGAKELHRGMDIAAPYGTPILAVHDGRVIFAGDAGSYGLCVVIEDDKGYRSRYAHCSSLSVSVGQEVKKGDTIAAVGSTGDSTGNHLHLEVTKEGQYLNPYYFVDTGSSGPGGAPGTPGGVDIPDNPGSPMGDGSYAAMLAEAERYLGYPYVWGGSSPSTSFDCSGYVSWVINQSGVGSVGRQTAQGLFNITTPVSASDAKPGDLIFFQNTYSSATPVTHVGIYVGGGRMIHCGDPISYANVNSSYWQSHFYSYGRL